MKVANLGTAAAYAAQQAARVEAERLEAQRIAERQAEAEAMAQREAGGSVAEGGTCWSMMSLWFGGMG